ncbi:hypothetical protein SAMN05443637_11066 [Pseudonocardia thermophila]|uniref:Fe-S cluster biogenesis protein NfuA, 4Fe-4S-binding domain n=1 Tax=Pseudonocardia thermophila TaxID=1848 RepID=A0A1M6UGY1_PSETH|nr:hypothetical protein [Pseudonocardia thermophila]SHK68436.1 hypothetical protein SAMN05443637_11066 [Pseudonocardia thermophila]
MTAVDPALQDALNHLQRMLGEDDYRIQATVVDDVSVDLRVIARDAACAECLVPKDMMRGIADEHLTATRYRVRVLLYPDDPDPDD